MEILYIFVCSRSCNSSRDAIPFPSVVTAGKDGVALGGSMTSPCGARRAEVFILSRSCFSRCKAGVFLDRFNHGMLVAHVDNPHKNSVLIRKLTGRLVRAHDGGESSIWW